MNLPNKLTVARIIATPFFMFAMIASFKGNFIVALVLFIAASLTDMLDGKIARKYNLVTDFGKFLDPLADKMLTTSAFLGFLWFDICPGIVWIVFIVLFREFMITSLRLVAVGSGRVIAANMWGKAKTVSQMAAIILTLLVLAVKLVVALPDTVVWVTDIVVAVALWASAVLTVISGIIYMIDNKDCIDHTK